MVEAFFAWVLLITGVSTGETNLIVASGLFAIAARIYFDKKGGE